MEYDSLSRDESDSLDLDWLDSDSLDSDWLDSDSLELDPLEPLDWLE